VLFKLGRWRAYFCWVFVEFNGQVRFSNTSGFLHQRRGGVVGCVEAFAHELHSLAREAEQPYGVPVGIHTLYAYND